MKNNTVLIIDDNPDDIIIAERAIKKSRPGCTMAIATSGVQARERLGTGPFPALILLDLKMPGIGGLDILKLIRSNAQTRRIPVVMVTSSTLESDIDAAYAAGASSYLFKSHDLSEFTATMKTTLHYWLDLNITPD